MEKSILIVDDDIKIAQLIEIYLKNEGYTTVKAIDGFQALEIMDKQIHPFSYFGYHDARNA
jgi:DNA-binding response OmpR family regulator